MAICSTKLCAQTLSNLSNLQSRFSFITDRKLTKQLVLPDGSAKGLGISGDPAWELNKWANAVSYADEHVDDLEKMFSAVKTNIFTLSLNSDNEAIQNLSYIVLALESQDKIEKYLRDNNIKGEDRKLVELCIQQIAKVVKTLANPTVSVFATGDIAGAISSEGSGTGSQNIAGTGSVGVLYSTSRNKILARIFVASTIDTLRSGLGQSLLNPVKGKAGSAIIEWYRSLNVSALGVPWLHLYGHFSNTAWKFDADSVKSTNRSVSILGAGALFNWTVFKGKIASTELGLNLEAGMSFRYLGGDVRSMLKNESDSASYIRSFPTNKNLFLGPEFGISVSVGSVVASLQGYWYIKSSQHQVPGLTGLQFNFGININASVISGSLN